MLAVYSPSETRNVMRDSPTTSGASAMASSARRWELFQPNRRASDATRAGLEDSAEYLSEAGGVRVVYLHKDRVIGYPAGELQR